MKKINYNGYIITMFTYKGIKEYKVELDQSWHDTLVSAQYHIDYLTK